MPTNTQPTPKFWLEAARFILNRNSMLYVNCRTGLPVLDQEEVHAFVTSITEDEAEWLELASVNEDLRRWQDSPLAKLDCTILDMQTANVLVRVYEALSEGKREKFRQLPLGRAVEIAWGCVR